MNDCKHNRNLAMNIGDNNNRIPRDSVLVFNYNQNFQYEKISVGFNKAMLLIKCTAILFNWLPSLNGCRIKSNTPKGIFIESFYKWSKNSMLKFQGYIPNYFILKLIY